MVEHHWCMQLLMDILMWCGLCSVSTDTVLFSHVNISKEFFFLEFNNNSKLGTVNLGTLCQTPLLKWKVFVIENLMKQSIMLPIYTWDIFSVWITSWPLVINLNQDVPTIEISGSTPVFGRVRSLARYGL